MLETQNVSKTRVIATFVAVIGGIVWLGGSVARAAIAFDLFVPGTLDFKPDTSADTALQTIRLFGVTAFYALAGYALFLLCGGALWAAERRLWKRRAGLFMAGALVALYVPVEIAQAYYDVQLAIMTQNGSLTLEVGKTLVLKRLGALGGASLLAMLGYATAIFWLAAKPLRAALSERRETANATADSPQTLE